MLCIWWSVHSIECRKLLAEGPTVIADVYFERLRNLKANLENAGSGTKSTSITTTSDHTLQERPMPNQ
ncbi:hypothetical protein Y032_0558g3415 [Ancylostoma ceylanicum]|uniref:Uncharacterized protein n=1 Tax=Ancylostoma ceylanicum TaxID=53326 RepID=A0A016WRU3_9BILA|nr:hypothetical protein Y032_0558g3415 [Ancylostoma ceylanicum]